MASVPSTPSAEAVPWSWKRCSWCRSPPISSDSPPTPFTTTITPANTVLRATVVASAGASEHHRRDQRHLDRRHREPEDDDPGGLPDPRRHGLGVGDRGEDRRADRHRGDGDEREARLRHEPGALRADEAPGDERHRPGPPARRALGPLRRLGDVDRLGHAAASRQSRAIRSVSSAKNAPSSTSRTKWTFARPPADPPPVDRRVPHRQLRAGLDLDVDVPAPVDLRPDAARRSRSGRAAARRRCRTCARRSARNRRASPRPPCPPASPCRGTPPPGHDGSGSGGSRRGDAAPPAPRRAAPPAPRAGRRRR